MDTMPVDTGDDDLVLLVISVFGLVFSFSTIFRQDVLDKVDVGLASLHVPAPNEETEEEKRQQRLEQERRDMEGLLCFSIGDFVF